MIIVQVEISEAMQIVLFIIRCYSFIESLYLWWLQTVGCLGIQSTLWYWSEFPALISSQDCNCMQTCKNNRVALRTPIQCMGPCAWLNDSGEILGSRIQQGEHWSVER